MRYRSFCLGFLLLGGQAYADDAGGRSSAPTPAAAAEAADTLWPGSAFPLPLKVESSDELAFKALAEREYLVFNLLVGGKVAYDRRQYEVAAKTWETLLRLPDLDPQTRKVVAPLLDSARAEVNRAAGTPDKPRPSMGALTEAPRPLTAMAAQYRISGTVTGGGRVGPGGAVLWLKRNDGVTPSPRPMRPRVVGQKNKAFTPHVMVVTTGSEVIFRNDDDFYHNVFSITENAAFDTGLYKSGKSASHVFTKPGPVELLCNIHASMYAYIYVVDSPYFAQPDGRGNFTIRGIPPGRYTLLAWHEAASKVLTQVVDLTAEDARGLRIQITADNPTSNARPDKYGKPRQPHLGY